jgi:glutamate-5-semialdehyde dehydrogenase
MDVVNLKDIGQQALQAGHALALCPSLARDAALEEIARRLGAAGEALWAANRADLDEARAAQVAAPLLDRATLTPAKVAGMAQGCRDVAALPDPLGEVFDGRTLPNGLRIAKRRVPLGVLGVIFESRPNVTIDISALAIKTGNAAIMRGGRESLRTNIVLADMVREACAAAGLPADAVQLIASTERSLVPALLAMDDVIDLVIPRGGPGLQALVKEHARMPVIYGGIGVCHIYVDASADLGKAIPLIMNAKIQAPSVCNAVETLLVHRAVAAEFLPAVVAALNAAGVEVRGDQATLEALRGAAGIDPALVKAAGPDDYGQEFLALVLSVRVVDSLDEAVAHIARYSTHHSDAILTNDYAHATRFVSEVDSSAVFVNASTRFNDGGQFGLGAEVAISTQKLHARGPVGAQALTTYKWVVEGDWHVRA